MPNSRKHWTSCARKMAYASEALAYAHLNSFLNSKIKQRGRKQTEKEQARNPLQIYKCVVCGDWHIGHGWKPNNT